MANPVKFKVGDRAYIESQKTRGIGKEKISGTIVQDKTCHSDKNNKGLAWKSDYQGSSPVCIGSDGITAKALKKIIGC